MPLAPRDDQGSLALTIGSSVLFGTAGFFVGGLAGSALTGDCGYFDCLEGVILGVLIGTPFGTAIGAHIGNGRRGSLGYDLLGGFAGSAAGTLILAVDSDNAIPVLLAGASVVALPVLVERKSAAQNAQARRVAVAATPMPNGFHVSMRVTMGG